MVEPVAAEGTGVFLIETRVRPKRDPGARFFSWLFVGHRHQLDATSGGLKAKEVVDLVRRNLLAPADRQVFSALDDATMGAFVQGCRVDKGSANGRRDDR